MQVVQNQYEVFNFLERPADLTGECLDLTLRAFVGSERPLKSRVEICEKVRYLHAKNRPPARQGRRGFIGLVNRVPATLQIAEPGPEKRGLPEPGACHDRRQAMVPRSLQALCQ